MAQWRNGGFTFLAPHFDAFSKPGNHSTVMGTTNALKLTVLAKIKIMEQLQLKILILNKTFPQKMSPFL